MVEIRTEKQNGKEVRICCLKTTIGETDCKNNISKVCDGCCIQVGNPGLPNLFKY